MFLETSERTQQQNASVGALWLSVHRMARARENKIKETMRLIGANSVLNICHGLHLQYEQVVRTRAFSFSFVFGLFLCISSSSGVSVCV